MSSDTKPGGGSADGGAWLAVAAGTIGALMATLDTSIVNAALPTIQGEIGASGADGTWVSTSYLVAEIVMIPMAAWFQSIFGLRNFLLIMVTLFTAASMWCGVAETLPHMIFGRVVQGFTGGAMIPTALTIVATRLPPEKQPIGVALFGMTAVLGPVLGPIVGGWLTEKRQLALRLLLERADLPRPDHPAVRRPASGENQRIQVLQVPTFSASSA